MKLKSGAKLGPYEIVSLLGKGGMGEVWKAHDSRLNRDVAIKTSHTGFSGRFRKEARSIAALNHPHICTLYDIGPDYLVMEFIGGSPLAGPLPADVAVRYATQIADAVSAAHAHGITHRDLKPGNILVTASGIKLLDFGLASISHGADDSETREPDATATMAMTRAGAILGTAEYMAPEQAEGRTADARSDIFSFGVVFYEMLTGRRAFSGGSTIAVLAAVLHKEVEPFDGPPALQNIVARCLRKSPTERFQTMEQVKEALLAVTAATTMVAGPFTLSSPDIRAHEGFWVAVLPFKSTGTNPDVAALAEGLSEEIVAGLSRFTYLRVIGRGSTLRYASQNTDVRTVGQELGARYVMEGSLRQAGGRLRVAVQLIDAFSGAHLWAETYDRAFVAEDVFELQDDLVPRIVSTVADSYGVLPHTMSQAVRGKDAGQLTPYEALLRSFNYSEHVTPEEHAAARAALEQAVQQAPGSADCWAMLSILYTDEFIFGFSGLPDALGRALEAAQRAVNHGSTNHKAYQALAWALFYRREFPASRIAAERTIALNPMDASAIARVGMTMAFSGDWLRGCELVTRAIGLNPNHPGWYWYPSFLEAYRRNDYRAALGVALRINMPGFPLTSIALAATYAQLGEMEPAHNAVRDLLALVPDYAAVARQELGKIWDAQLVEHLIDGLRKAGMDIA